tara:strand:- start:67 stop:633 length:567 start_codon:yes stop_codon:yes gene_type:complete
MKLHLIRHAESVANAAADLDNPTYYYDACITKKGKEQAYKLSQKIKNISFDKYYCSPLTRTLETFSLIFPNKKPILDPLLREHLYHSCDVGRQPRILKKEFKTYDFSNLPDYWWNDNIPINQKTIKQENHNDIKIRLKKFILSLRNVNCQNIIIVSHGTYLSQITEYMLDNCELFICNYDEIYKKFIN